MLHEKSSTKNKENSKKSHGLLKEFKNSVEKKSIGSLKSTLNEWLK